MFVVASDGGLLGEPVQLNELMMHAGERYEVLVDARDGKVFDLVTRPVPQMAINLPPFDSELKLVTIRPDGAESKGRLPETLANCRRWSGICPLQASAWSWGCGLTMQAWAL